VRRFLAINFSRQVFPFVPFRFSFLGDTHPATAYHIVKVTIPTLSCTGVLEHSCSGMVIKGGKLSVARQG